MNKSASSQSMSTVPDIDPREIRPHAERNQDHLTRLRRMLASAMSQPYYQHTYKTLPVLEHLSDLEQLPILRKQDLIAIQSALPPFGGIMGDTSQADYLFISPGPILEPGFTKPEFWRISRAMRARGFASNDIVHNTFSYHLTPGAWMLDSGAKAIGCSVIPAGNAPIEQQVMAIFQYNATAYTGTPDFLKILLKACEAADRGPVPFKKALVSGGALTPGLRDFFSRTNIDVGQCYATAELGLIAYEVEATGHMIVDEDVFVEIIDPATGKAMPPGEVGEVVVTTMRDDYPLIRFGTGDLSAFVKAPARTDARTGAVLAGWLGRADQTAKVRGQFIRPNQLVMLQEQIDEIHKVRLVIDRENEKDQLMLFCEMENDAHGDQEDIKKSIIRHFRELCHLKTRVKLVKKGTIEDDGKLIVDMR